MVGLPALEPLRRAVKNEDLETSRRPNELVKTIEGYADLRYYLVWGIAFVGPSAKDATPLVASCSRTRRRRSRRKAAFALGRIDADASKVTPILVAALADADNDVRDACALTLTKKMSKEAVPILIRTLKGDQADLWKMSMKVFGPSAR